MSLSALYLDAFAEIVRSGSFSVAAKKLFVTQSALSQRLSKLESELGTTLLIRDPSGIRLTAAGESLMRYCRTRAAMEDEFLIEIAASTNQVSGLIRIGGFSSVMRSFIMPAIDQLIRKDTKLKVQLFTREIRELPRMLQSGEIDVAFSNEAYARHDVASKLIGHEENILVEAERIESKQSNVYLDHDEDDPTTIEYLQAQGKSTKNIQRIYLDEVYSIIDAVALGWGRAVIPRHLVEANRKIRPVKGFKSQKSPIYLCYVRQPYYSKAMERVISAFAEEKH
jgi:DNA-binding transcriptional LysR family regulator